MTSTSDFLDKNRSQAFWTESFVDAEEIDFDGREGVASDAKGDGDSWDEGTEFPFVIVCCSETDMPYLFVVGNQQSPEGVSFAAPGCQSYHFRKEAV